MVQQFAHLGRTETASARNFVRGDAIIEIDQHLAQIKNNNGRVSWNHLI